MTQEAFPGYTSGPPGLDDAKSVDDVLRRSGGGEVLAMLRRLGFWTGDAQSLSDRNSRKAAFPRKFSSIHDVGSDTLGDYLAYWSSEQSRALEVLGALDGERYRLQLAIERARAEAGLEIINQAKETGERITKQEIDIRVENHPKVREAIDRLAPVQQLYLAVLNFKNAAEVRAAAISREITRRGDLARGRVDVT